MTVIHRSVGVYVCIYLQWFHCDDILTLLLCFYVGGRRKAVEQTTAASFTTAAVA